MSRVTPSHLMDRDLFDFVNLRPTGTPDPQGDMAFDQVDPVNPQEAASDDCGSAPADGPQPIRFTRLVSR